MKRLGRMVFRGWIYLVADVQEFIDTAGGWMERSRGTLAVVLLSVVVAWFVYVPVHELLHVAGCLVTGGTVSELVMGREYGADFLKEIFPFITPQTSRYAGRLTGFEPSGDFGYLMTDFYPFVLSLFPGVWLFLASIRRRLPWLAGPGLVVGLAPFMNLTGDYFEMGTILSTRLFHVLAGGVTRAIPSFWQIRSDDMFRLFGEMAKSPAEYGLTAIGTGVVSVCVVVIGAVLAALLCGWTYQAGRWIAVKTMEEER